MAKIKKLYKKTGKDTKELVYPVTITQAIKDGETGQNLHDYMNDVKPKFKFDATQTDSQLGTVGTIMLSQDGGKTWNPISPEFLNNLRIQDYVATTSALPANKPVGTIYGVGPTYAAEDTAQTNPIYRIYVYNGTTWVDNGQFTSIAAGIVQETGDSETEVMSQKATTEKLTELASNLSGFPINNIGSIRKTTGVITEDETWVNSGYVDITNIKSIRVKGRSGTYTTMLAYYSSNKAFLGYYDISNGIHDVIVNVSDMPIGTVYITASGANGEENYLYLYPEKSILNIIKDNHCPILDVDKLYPKADGEYYDIISAASAIPYNLRKEKTILVFKESPLLSHYWSFIGDESQMSFWDVNQKYWRKILFDGDKIADTSLFSIKNSRVTTSGAIQEHTNFDRTPYLKLSKTEDVSGFLIFNNYCLGVAFFDSGYKYISSWEKPYNYFQYFTIKVDGIPTNAEYVVFTTYKGDGENYAGIYSGIIKETNNKDIFVLNEYKSSALNSLGYSPTTPQQYKQLTFLHASDTHSVTDRYANIGKVLNNYGNLKFALLTGDLVTTDFSQPFTPYEAAIAETNKPIMFVLGNHDVGNVADVSLELNGTNEQCYEKYFAPYINNWGVVHEGNNNYYYYDDVDSKIRLIGLFEYDNLCELNDEGTALKDVRTKRSYSQEQIDWFINCLITLPDDYGVIIAQHQAEDMRQDGTNDFCSPVIPTGWGFDTFFEYINYRWIFPINRIVDAFINKTVINETINQTGGNVPQLSLVADFTNRNENQEFICYLGGHQHNDYIGFLRAYPQQLQVQIGCSKFDRTVQDLYRNEDDVTQDCMNLMSIDRNFKKIYIARFGADTSYSMQDRRFISISYKSN